MLGTLDLSKIDKVLVEQVKAYLREEVRRFDMEEGITKYEKHAEGLPDCLTTCCIAGAICLVKNKGVPFIFSQYKKSQASWPIVEDFAGKALTGLSYPYHEEFSRTVFYVENWPEDLLNDWRELNAHDKAGQVELACQRLDRFVEFGE